MAGNITGFSKGAVTAQNFRHAEAPSTSAASYNSAGIDCRPPKATTIIKGNPNQILVIITAKNASKGEVSQVTPDCESPKYLSKRFMAPYS